MCSQRTQLRQVIVGMRRREEDPLYAVENAKHRMGETEGSEVGCRPTSPRDQLVLDSDERRDTLAARCKAALGLGQLTRRGRCRVEHAGGDRRVIEARCAREKGRREEPREARSDRTIREHDVLDGVGK